ncbi:hypothetical protein TI39_contig5906g00003 [Zymoseptoria brevis]|uniref:Uncharacterized protein n=1 Tax=Zymoseptoria brevis TaxID=1047168 RepID=A0A0F4G520_9PEZI|nr:hypothetical protein TI39_contig5906g00003 [Zymoseptoria brevis]
MAPKKQPPKKQPPKKQPPKKQDATGKDDSDPTGGEERPVKKLKLTLQDEAHGSQVEAHGSQVTKSAEEEQSAPVHGKKKVDCETCGRDLSHLKVTLLGPKGGRVCAACKKKANTEKKKAAGEKDKRSEGCDKIMPVGSTHVYQGLKGGHLCGKCYEKTRKTKEDKPCEECGKTIPAGRLLRNLYTGKKGGNLCLTCYQKTRKIEEDDTCDECGETIPAGAYQLYTGSKGGRMCRKCYDTRYYSKRQDDAEAKPERNDCESCGRETHAGTVRFRGEKKGCVCKTCHEKKNISAKRSHQGEKTCSDCGTLVYDEDEFCSVCRQRHDAHETPPYRPVNNTASDIMLFRHAEIRDVAIQEFRELNPNHDPHTQDLQPRTVSSERNYWYQTVDQMRETLRQRGVVRGVAKGHRRHLIRWLQIIDALDGVLPQPRPAASRYHEMDIHALKRLATEDGFFRRREPPEGTAQNFATFLAEDPWLQSWDNAEQATPPETLVTQLRTTAQRADRALANRTFASDPPTSNPPTSNPPTSNPPVNNTSVNDGAPVNIPVAENPADSVEDLTAGIIATHNGGLWSLRETFASLQQTLNESFLPSHTSSIGLLCGVWAYTGSRVEWMRRMANRYPHQYERPDMSAEEMGHQLMERLFENYDRANPAANRVLGIPTQAYREYLDHRLAPLLAAGGTAFQDEYNYWLRMYDIDANLIGVLDDFANQEQLGGVAPDFGIGVVAGAFTNNSGNEVPANARIVRAGDPTVPHIWVHDYRALGQNGRAGAYNHFESFARGGRLEEALEWGMTPGDLGLLSGRQRFDPRDPAVQAHQTEMDRLKAAARQAQRMVTERNDKLARCCRRCQVLDRLDCDGMPGDPPKTCSLCKEHGDHCIHDRDLPMKPKFVTMTNYTKEISRPWDIPMTLDDRAKYYDLASDHQPELEPEVEHHAVIVIGRMSSHRGWLAVAANLGNSRRFQPAAVRRLFAMSLARRGIMPVPVDMGGVQDNFLASHFEFWHGPNGIMRPNNPNPPTEITYLLQGIAGFSTPITGWIAFYLNIVQIDGQNQTNIANRIWLMFAVERRGVIDGSPGSVVPGRHLADWLLWGNKYVRKVRLVDLYNRWHNMLQQPPVLAATQFEGELDDILTAMEHEGFMRSGHYGAGTNPTWADVMGRNHSRNSPWT